MRRTRSYIGLTTAALVAAVVVFVVATLPPRARRLGEPRRPDLVWGAYHVHSTRSDGSGSVDEIAAAAARAGLHFVILTDHGDGTSLEPPRYLHGVLCIDAVEVNSESGHIVALNLKHPAPYPLAGEARDVIEDIHRLGGWAVIAHPDSPRPALRWRGRDLEADGFEWFNVDSEWRAHGAWRLSTTALRSLIRAPEAIGSLFDSPVRSFERWDARARPGAPFTVAGLDAHARIGSDADGRAKGVALRVPGYASLFRAVAQAVVLSSPLQGDARTDSALVLDGLGQGQSYTVVRAFADALPHLTFTAADGSAQRSLSGSLAIGATAPSPVRVTAAIEDAPDVQLTLLRDGRSVLSSTRSLMLSSAAPGRYRLEAFIGPFRFPWVVSNAIDVGGEVAQHTSEAESPSSASTPTIPAATWQLEKDPSTAASISATEDAVALRYRLGGGNPAGQYAALSAPAGPNAIERIEFAGTSSSPMRVSIQVRVASGGPDGQRWRRSVYLDEHEQTISVRLADLEPVDRRSILRPIVAKVQSVLIVVDTVNARPGASGEFTMRNVRFVRGAGPVSGR